MTAFEEEALQLILAAGDARASAFQALQSAKTADFESAQQSLKQAETHLAAAHKEYKKILEAEANNQLQAPTLLLMHAHAQVMSAITEKTLIEELLELYKRL